MVSIEMEMTVKNTEGTSGHIKEPVIVVSDVHLGGKSSNYEDFWGFLEWLSRLPVDGSPFKCEDTELMIKRPGTIVLLGDILELWDPRDDDRNYVAKDVLIPLSILNKLDCDIIYVIGNHDEDIYEIKKVWKAKGVRFPYKGKGTFKIFYRTYPERTKDTKRIDGVKIGQNRYAFLHGHQFDRFQVFYKISRYLKVRFDPIDWHQDLANVSFTKNIGRTFRATFVFSLLFFFYMLGYILWFRDTPIWSGFGILWILISSFFVATILPKVVTFSNTEIWRRIPRTIVKKCTSVDDVIKDRYNRDKGQHIDANIIVFGHTHNAGKYFEDEEKRLFINTGCWVRECAKEKRNAFLYIDDKAPYLLTWDKEKVANGEITCLDNFKELLG
jgi:UDP-2,3-diacylglucosamine pyrophosphatase LpxH